jgi:hypothetical protein
MKNSSISVSRRIVELSELSMLLLLCQHGIRENQGALKSKMTSLEKMITKRIAQYGKINHSELLKMHTLIEKFAHLSGWREGEDFLAWISFAIGISESHPKLLAKLDEIQKYFDLAGKDDPNFEDVGAKALDIWTEMTDWWGK